MTEADLWEHSMTEIASMTEADLMQILSFGCIAHD